MRITDGKKTVEIEMCEYDERTHNYTPDWSEDFFETGHLLYDEEEEAYIVEDVEYCIEQAEDWKNNRGDYEDEGTREYIERCVFINE